MEDDGIIISFCLSGRNDGYGHDFLRRFEQSMNFLAFSAKEAGVSDKIEVLFTDWNVLTPIASAVKFSVDAARMVKFIEVPREIAEKHNFPNTPFHTSKSSNTALRRARGVYLACLPADIFMTSCSLKNLIRLLTGNCRLPFDLKNSVMGIPRKFIPFHCKEEHYFYNNLQIENFLLLNDHYLDEDKAPRGIHGSYGYIILSKELNNELRGFNEAIGGWGGNDSELALRANFSGPVISLSAFGIVCYDYEPNKSMRKEKIERNTLFSGRISSEVNTDDWGLNSRDLKISLPEPSAGYCTSPSEKKQLAPDVLSDKMMRDKLLLMTRFLSLKRVSVISSTAIILSNITAQVEPENYLSVNDDDLSSHAAISLLSPMTNISIASDMPGNYEYFLNSGGILRETRHAGFVRYIPGNPGEISFGAHYDLIYVNLDCYSSETSLLFDALNALKSPDCIIVLKSLNDRNTYDKARGFLIASCRHTVIELCDLGMLISADFSSAVKNIVLKNNGAWEPIRCNFIAGLIISLNIDWLKIAKAMRILARTGLLSFWKLIDKIHKI